MEIIIKNLQKFEDILILKDYSCAGLLFRRKVIGGTHVEHARHVGYVTRVSLAMSNGQRKFKFLEKCIEGTYTILSQG